MVYLNLFKKEDTMDRKTELKAHIFDLIKQTEDLQARVQSLHVKRQKLLVELQDIENFEQTPVDLDPITA